MSCLQEGTRTGAIEPATAATLSAALMSGTTTPLDALTAALGMGANGTAPPQVPGTLTHDYEFAAVELVKPTRMNKVCDERSCKNAVALWKWPMGLESAPSNG